MASQQFQYDKLPTTITTTILEIERLQVTDDIRRRYKFLNHVPLGADVAFVECDLKSLISKECYSQFFKTINTRHLKRQAKQRKKQREEEQAQRLEEEEKLQRKYELEERKRTLADSSQFPEVQHSMKDGNNLNDDDIDVFLKSQGAAAPPAAEQQLFGANSSSKKSTWQNNGKIAKKLAKQVALSKKSEYDRMWENAPTLGGNQGNVASQSAVSVAAEQQAQPPLAAPQVQGDWAKKNNNNNNESNSSGAANKKKKKKPQQGSKKASRVVLVSSGNFPSV